MVREKEMTTYSTNVSIDTEVDSVPTNEDGTTTSVDNAAEHGVFLGENGQEVETPSRQNWSNSTEFILSCVAMSVGLGNLWRFPFVCYEHGGGAFLIPYLIVLMVIGRPMALLELAIGQFSSSGHIKIWKMNPLFKGVGYSATFVNFCVTSYYCTISATSLWYFLASFRSTLPWTECDSEWSDVVCNSNDGTAWLNSSTMDANNTFKFNVTQDGTKTTIPALYVRRTVFKQIDSIVDGIGLPDLKLAMCLLFFWFVVFGSRIRGVQSSGKTAYFTALFPYFVLFIFLVVGLTLPGAWDGVLYFITPDFSKLLDSKTWFAAIEQCFYSLSVGFGPVIMNASYNPFRYNVYNAALILGAVDTFTSLLAGVTVFAILGHLKAELNVTDILQVTSGGSSLVFEVYPLLISKLPMVPQLFGALFFLMLFTLGLGSTISDTGSMITVIHDQFPKVKKIFVTAGVCAALFFSSLIYVTPGGGWILELVDYYGCVLVIVFTTALEIMGIAWVYGLSNLVRDIEFMLPGRKIGIFWKICWGLVIPVGLSVILFETLRNVAVPTFENKAFPPLAIGMGWALCGLGLLIIPLCALHTIATRKNKNIILKIKESTKPSLAYGPQDKHLHFEWSQLPPPTPYKKALLNFITRSS